MPTSGISGFFRFFSVRSQFLLDKKVIAVATSQIAR